MHNNHEFHAVLAYVLCLGVLKGYVETLAEPGRVIQPHFRQQPGQWVPGGNGTYAHSCNAFRLIVHYLCDSNDGVICHPDVNESVGDYGSLAKGSQHVSAD